jgi:hypothetical protein
LLSGFCQQASMRVSDGSNRLTTGFVKGLSYLVKESTRSLLSRQGDCHPGASASSAAWADSLSGFAIPSGQGLVILNALGKCVGAVHWRLPGSLADELTSLLGQIRD